ncbi:hypothetical protein C0992_006117 [Termitomyces sp. T32_za158]|nr:hypothetical protein C0992_006117 [Termitomyces sp. T32_za158]
MANLHGLNLGAGEEGRGDPGPDPGLDQGAEQGQQERVEQVEQGQADGERDQQQNDGVEQALRERIRELEAQAARANFVAMFADAPTIAAASVSARDSPRKALPGISKGHKANPLGTGECWFCCCPPLPPPGRHPPKGGAGFRSVCIRALLGAVKAARSKALSGVEELTILATGLVARGLDRSAERGISTLEWAEASSIAEQRVRHYHGADYADALASHHSLVMKLGYFHGWSVAVRYDIQQREAAAADPTHDLSTLDATALSLITSQMASQAAAHLQALMPGMAKRPTSGPDSPPPSE